VVVDGYIGIMCKRLSNKNVTCVNGLVFVAPLYYKRDVQGHLQGLGFWLIPRRAIGSMKQRIEIMFCSRILSLNCMFVVNLFNGTSI